MLLRRADIEKDVCQIKTRWLEGGYSDDLLVGAAAFDNNRTIATPIRALFPNTVKKDVSFDAAWDFMRRQVFTLITYSSPKHWREATTLYVVYIIGGFIPLPCTLLSFLTLICTGILLAMQQPIDVFTDINVILSLAFLVTLFIAMCLQKVYLLRCHRLVSALSPKSEITDFELGCFMQVLSFLF